VRAIVRDPARATEVPRQADLVLAENASAQAQACAGVDSIVSCAPAEASVALLAALAPPLPQLVLLGSTRRWTAWPDHRAATVIALEHAFAALGFPGVLLYPTMIYGAGGENNVRRIAALARLRVVPLPKGGRALIQPVHTEDVARAVVAAVVRRLRHPEPIVLAGPEPMAYSAFVRAVAAATGRRIAILPVPLPVAFALGAIVSLVPGLPRISRAEIRRLVEDKAFDIAPARELLGFDPMPLEQGLARTFGLGDM